MYYFNSFVPKSVLLCAIFLFCFLDYMNYIVPVSHFEMLGLEQ